MPETATAHEITITRVFDAAREAVWRAWTEPAQLARWWGKRGWTAKLSSITMDVRPGGVFRLTSVNDEDGSEMAQDAVYREVVEPERLVFDGGTGTSGTVTFTDLGDGRTEMTFHATLHTTAEVRDRAAGGLASAFGRLAEHLDRSTTKEP